MSMDLETETLLMFAARREHLARLIEPALAKGEWVICDRFSDATYAYQGGGRGLERHKLQQLEQWVHGHLQPDMTLLFDLPLDVARERIALASRVLDRFEQERADFHERVRQAYLERWHSSPGRIHVIDAQGSIETIRKSLEEVVATIY
jgi:dTMP kinase